MTKNLYCVVGESGSGKDTIVNYMCNRYGYTKVISNTTRPIRTNDENDKFNHIFSNVEQYQQDKENNEVVAETFFNGNVYWATKTQVNNSDFYGIDIKGLKHLQDTYRDRKIITIYVETNEATRRLRMEERGDSEETIEERKMCIRDRYNIEETTNGLIITERISLQKAIKQVKAAGNDPNEFIDMLIRNGKWEGTLV